MAEKRLGIIMNGVTGRMGTNQHLIRSICAIRDQGGVALADGTRVFVTASVGYALAPRDGDSGDDLARRAELAITHAKAAGGGVAIAFVPQMDLELTHRRALETALRKAVNDEAIKVIVNEVIPIDNVKDRFTKSILLDVNLDSVDEGTIFELGKLLEKNRGNCVCYFNVNGGGLAKNSIYFTRKYVIDPNNQFISAVKNLLGESAVRLQG